jgi:cytochrome c553
VDANCQGQDGDTTNGEMIRKTATEKEKEKERATHDAATEGRRKRRKSRHRRSLSSSEEDDIKEEGEQGIPRSGDEDDGDSG